MNGKSTSFGLGASAYRSEVINEFEFLGTIYELELELELILPNGTKANAAGLVGVHVRCV
jgi:hypothetical protein